MYSCRASARDQVYSCSLLECPVRDRVQSTDTTETVHHPPRTVLRRQSALSISISVSRLYVSDMRCCRVAQVEGQLVAQGADLHAASATARAILYCVHRYCDTCTTRLQSNLPVAAKRRYQTASWPLRGRPPQACAPLRAQTAHSPASAATVPDRLQAPEAAHEHATPHAGPLRARM